MATVGIHPPKTPVLEKGMHVAKATLPNVCKMPGPPAPFVPTPLPNIGKSNLSPQGYSTTVKIEGSAVAIRGATFNSIGDIASKPTGGGLVSANVEGVTKFITPGSFTVKIESKPVQLLGEAMLNNCGPSGSPPNTGATLMGNTGPDAPKPGDVCAHANIRRDPEKGTETRSTEEQAQAMDDEADRLDGLGKANAAAAATATGLAANALKDRAAGNFKGAADKRFEAKVTRDTQAKETNVKVMCKDCGMTLAEFDVITNNGTHKECKSSGGAVSVGQLYKEIELAALPTVGGPGTAVHLAIPGGQRKAALNRFVRSGGRKMTNKGAGYDRLIQEH
jgi:uncharacterized Zn-binding protein involved in type VI secretion